jgi:hypothetical protein
MKVLVLFPCWKYILETKHTGEKPYFRGPDEVLTYKTAKHTGEKPYLRGPVEC